MHTVPDPAMMFPLILVMVFPILTRMILKDNRVKGPGATALYSSRAASGALVITTKSGSRKDKGIGVTFNSNSSINTVLKWPDYQYEYGQGTGKAS